MGARPYRFFSRFRASMEVENGALIIRKPRTQSRQGWAEASKAIAAAGEDTLVMGEFPNADDVELPW